MNCVYVSEIGNNHRKTINRPEFGWDCESNMPDSPIPNEYFEFVLIFTWTQFHSSHEAISSAFRVHKLSDCQCAAVIKMGDKLFCTINAKWVPSHSDLEQWTYKCIVIFYRLLRYAHNQSDMPRTHRVAVCVCVCVWGKRRATGDGYACIYYATHTIHKDNKTCWRHAVDEWSGASCWPACVTPPIYKMKRFRTMNTTYICCMALWLCTQTAASQIDASDNNNIINRKRNEKRRFLLHIHSIGLMERDRLTERMEITTEKRIIIIIVELYFIFTLENRNDIRKIFAQFTNWKCCRQLIAMREHKSSPIFFFLLFIIDVIM